MLTVENLTKPNAWYRIRSTVVTDPNTKQPLVHFVHPVGPGKDDDGWMKPNPEDAEQSSGGLTLNLFPGERGNPVASASISMHIAIHTVISGG